MSEYANYQTLKNQAHQLSLIFASWGKNILSDYVSNLRTDFELRMYARAAEKMALYRGNHASIAELYFTGLIED